MSRLISILIIALALWGGWHLFEYWQQLQTEKKVELRQAANAATGDQLPGMPQALEPSWRAAHGRGDHAMGAWLKAYGKAVKDPRKAWIQLDYCVMLSRDDPVQAKKIFAEVKKRTPPSSPVYQRIKDLEQSFQ